MENEFSCIICAQVYSTLDEERNFDAWHTVTSVLAYHNKIAVNVKAKLHYVR